MGWDGQEIIVLTPDMIGPDSDSNQIHLLTAGNVLSRSFPQAAAGGCRNGTDRQTESQIDIATRADSVKSAFNSGNAQLFVPPFLSAILLCIINPKQCLHFWDKSY